MFAKLFLISAVITVVWCYDFQDAHYNELLIHDLLDAADITGEREFTNVRHRRDAEATTADVSSTTLAAPEDDEKKCKSHRSYKCCVDDFDQNAFGKMKELKRSCFHEVRGADRTLHSKSAESDSTSLDLLSTDKVNKTKGDIVCVMDCVTKKQGIVDDKGDVVLAKAKTYIQEKITSGAWQKDVINGVLERCVTEAADKKGKQAEPTKCNPYSSYFVYCVWRELTLACPADKQDQSKKCIKLREKFAKNEQVPFKPDFEE